MNRTARIVASGVMLAATLTVVGALTPVAAEIEPSSAPTATEAPSPPAESPSPETSPSSAETTSTEDPAPEPEQTDAPPMTDEELGLDPHSDCRQAEGGCGDPYITAGMQACEDEYARKSQAEYDACRDGVWFGGGQYYEDRQEAVNNQPPSDEPAPTDDPDAP